MNVTGKVVGLFVLLGLAGTSWAGVKMPAIFGDHMVLQQDIKLPVWGWADPGEKVTVALAGQKAEATAGPDGKWMVKLEPVKTDAGPLDMVVESSQASRLVFHDVLVGDVWLCSGQSNMEYGLMGAHNAATEVPQADYPKIRLFKVVHKVAFEPQSDCEGKWVLCTPQSANGFSAVGYFFGREIHRTQGRPVGLIGSYWGGTSAQVWTSLDGLRGRPEFKESVEAFESFRANRAQVEDEYVRKILPDWEARRQKWQEEFEAPHQLACRQWPLEAEKAKAAGKPLPPRPVLKQSAPPKPTCRTQVPNIPAALNMGMIAPLVPYAIKGVIWYQGESNQGNPALYRSLFPAMITDWRKSWGQGDFPFLFVQLPNYNTVSDWPSLRESQVSALALPKTGMAVAIDIGETDNGHPHNKMDVGCRLALVARHVAYGQDVVWSGPLFKSMKVEGDKIRIAFDHIGSGLEIATAPSIQSNAPPAVPDSALKGFIIAGADQQFVPAQARIEGDGVVVWSARVPQPVAVRYGWASNPDVNLCNKERLPAAPFRTDLTNEHYVIPEQMRQVYEEVKTPYKYGVVIRGEEGKPVDCPSVFRHQDKWYMMYVCMNKVGYETRLAESADLLNWKPLGTIMKFRKEGWDAWQADGGVALCDPTWGGSCGLQQYDGKYWLSYIGGALQGYETDPLAIGIAWTKTPTAVQEWTRIPGNPVLSRDQPDVRAFERGTLYKSQIVWDKAGTLGFPFVMFYNARSGPERIGMAVSKDMVNWKRFGAQPVVAEAKGICGDPQLVRIGGLWVMFYFGAYWGPAICDTFAASKDLVHWTKWQGPNLVEPSTPWDSGAAHKPWLVKHDGVVYHFYCACGDKGRVIGLATSRELRHQ